MFCTDSLDFSLASLIEDSEISPYYSFQNECSRQLRIWRFYCCKIILRNITSSIKVLRVVRSSPRKVFFFIIVILITHASD